MKTKRKHHSPSTVDYGLLTVDYLKLLYALLMLAMLMVFIASCSEDDKPKTLAQVTTFAATAVETNSVMAHGEIADDGNDKITESGFVYSNVQSTPTIDDSKVVVSADDDNQLTLLIEGLSSGSIYHIRAFATNSKGTAYGEAKDFETGNAEPTAENVTITGAVEGNGVLTVEYDYEDAESDPEGATIIQWYVDADGAAGGETAIDGATELTYRIPDEDFDGKYIVVSVTPKATAGTLSGTEVKSAHTVGIGEATTVTFVYNNNEVTYGIITSSVTGRKWLDRSLGAAGTPTAIDNWQNYGDVFQWGRGADGHQLVTRQGPTTADITGSAVAGTDTNPAVSSSDSPGHASFIPNNTTASKYDWRSPQNDNLWQGVNGINNPCPTGWKIPTKTEWEAENLTTISAAYTQLKLTYNHTRNQFGSSSFGGNGLGMYWTSTGLPYPGLETVHVSYNVRINNTNTTYNTANGIRAQGYECRCIKE